MAGLANLWDVERSPWHVAYTTVTIFLFLFPDHRLYIVKNMCVYTYWTP
jgi:hypothetical protein